MRLNISMTHPQVRYTMNSNITGISDYSKSSELFAIGKVCYSDVSVVIEILDQCLHFCFY